MPPLPCPWRQPHPRSRRRSRRRAGWARRSDCLRRVDGNKHYPEDRVGEVHADGEIWSRALWDIHEALGARTADTIIIRAQFRFTAGISMPKAALATIETAGLYGTKAQKAVQAAFAARGLA